MDDYSPESAAGPAAPDRSAARVRRPRSPDGMIAAATILLLLGVEGVSATAEMHAGWWAFGGFLCLLFVPALIFDAVVEKVRRR